MKPPPSASAPIATATPDIRQGSVRSRGPRRLRTFLILGLAAVASSSATLAYLFLVAAPDATMRSLRRTTAASAGETEGPRGTVAVRPIRDIEHGAPLPPNGRTPVVMIRSSLEERLLARFREERPFSCDEAELNATAELDNRVSHPVYVYEGYYHGLSTAEKVYSKNPNPTIGTDFMKPAAGDFTRAFFDAFRHANRDIFDRLKEELADASSARGDEDDVCLLLSRWIERGLHFGDLSVQIHYGQGNRQKLTSGAAWHADAENSLLHLAVTLRGTRELRSMRVRSRDGALEEVREVQRPGDVYLSSSALMRHAPLFFDADHRGRSVAIHARFLYTSREVERLRRARTGESWRRLTRAVAEVLARADLRVPSLEQVESRLATMKAEDAALS